MAHPSMDRRFRSPAARRSPPRGDERSQHHHRFLRPGALARLRDSKIIARSLRCAAGASPSPARLPPPSSPPLSSTPAPAAEAGGGMPHFLGGARGLRYPLRKKLAAARSVVFLPPPMSPEAAEVLLDAFAAAPSELVAAH